MNDMSGNLCRQPYYGALRLCIVTGSSSSTIVIDPRCHFGGAKLASRYLCEYAVPQVSFFFLRLLGGTDIFEGSGFFFSKAFPKNGRFRNKMLRLRKRGLSLDGVFFMN